MANVDEPLTLNRPASTQLGIRGPAVAFNNVAKFNLNVICIKLCLCFTGSAADRRPVGAGSAASIFGAGYQWIY